MPSKLDTSYIKGGSDDFIPSIAHSESNRCLSRPMIDFVSPGTPLPSGSSIHALTSSMLWGHSKGRSTYKDELDHWTAMDDQLLNEAKLGKSRIVASRIAAPVVTEITNVLASGFDPSLRVETFVRQLRAETERRNELARFVLAHDCFAQQEALSALKAEDNGCNETLLDSLREKSELIGLPRQGSYSYPAFQFNTDTGRLREEVAEINRHLGANQDPWGVATWWYMGNERLNAPPVEILKCGERSAALLTAARAAVQAI